MSYISPNQEHTLFEQYSERARRVIFLTRRKAGQSGAAALEIENLVEALVLEDQGKFADAMDDYPSALAISSSKPSVQFFAPETGEDS